MKNKKYIYTFSVLLLCSPLSVFAEATSTTIAASSTPATSSSTTPSVLGVHTASVPLIITQITQAKAQLTAVILNHALIPTYKNVKDKKTGKTTKVVSKYTLGDKDIALAVLDPATGNIITTIGRQNGTSMVFPDPAVDVKLTRFNGVNSRFTVNKPAGGTVMALKYQINKVDSGTKAAIENGLSEAVYVPYSSNLNSPEVSAYGQSYLNGVIDTVVKQLQDTPSTAMPGQTITQAVPPSMIKALVYAEHSDTTALLAGDVQGLLDQMNILLAANGPDTYKYSGSSAGALGIAQFISSTYGSLVTRHSEANLIPNFALGMQNHVNSIKAMYLLLDDYAGVVRVKAQNGFVSARIFDYGAASYNGGTTRVVKAVNEFGDYWNQDRSGQINSTQSEVNSLTSQVKNLKAKIKTTKDAKTKKTFQSQLSSAQNQLATSTSKLATLQSATLRNETVNYLAKIYKVVGYFNDQQLAYRN